MRIQVGMSANWGRVAGGTSVKLLFCHYTFIEQCVRLVCFSGRSTPFMWGI